MSRACTHRRPRKEKPSPRRIRWFQRVRRADERQALARLERRRSTTAGSLLRRHAGGQAVEQLRYRPPGRWTWQAELLAGLVAAEYEKGSPQLVGALQRFSELLKALRPGKRGACKKSVWSAWEALERNLVIERRHLFTERRRDEGAGANGPRGRRVRPCGYAPGPAMLWWFEQERKRLELAQAEAAIAPPVGPAPAPGMVDLPCVGLKAKGKNYTIDAGAGPRARGTGESRCAAVAPVADARHAGCLGRPLLTASDWKLVYAARRRWKESRCDFWRKRFADTNLRGELEAIFGPAARLPGQGPDSEPAPAAPRRPTDARKGPAPPSGAPATPEQARAAIALLLELLGDDKGGRHA